jgi:FlaG/FlaF family flagellin (archaellin)
VNVSITAAASDNVRVATVIIYVDGAAVCGFYAPPYTCNWTTPKKAGTHTINVNAWDPTGNMGSAAGHTFKVK